MLYNIIETMKTVASTFNFKVASSTKSSDMTYNV